MTALFVVPPYSGSAGRACSPAYVIVIRDCFTHSGSDWRIPQRQFRPFWERARTGGWARLLYDRVGTTPAGILDRHGRSNPGDPRPCLLFLVSRLTPG